MSGAVHTTLERARCGAPVGVGKVVVGLPAGALYGEVPSREQPIKDGRPFAPTGVRGVIARTVVELLERRRGECTTSSSPRWRSARSTDRGSAPTVEWSPRSPTRSSAASRSRSTATAARHATSLFIDDAVDAFVRATQRGGGLVVNIGTGTSTSIRDLWTALAGPVRTGASPRRRRGPDDLARVALSPTRAAHPPVVGAVDRPRHRPARGASAGRRFLKDPFRFIL